MIYSLLFSVLIFVNNDSCKCYEGKTETDDLYTLFIMDTTSELIVLSKFHGEYTPFNYTFNFQIEANDQNKRINIPRSSILLIQDRKHLCLILEKSPTTEVIKLKKRRCKGLKIYDIPNEKVLENNYPGFGDIKIPLCGK